jgi:hypothetical protein
VWVHEFSDDEIITKNKNRFPNCSGIFSAEARIIFMTKNYWCEIIKFA